MINVLRGVAQMGARVVWDHEVAGSIPVTPTIKKELQKQFLFYFLILFKILKISSTTSWYFFNSFFRLFFSSLSLLFSLSI